MRLRTLMASGADVLAAELDSVLGTAWDEALEAYRDGGEGAEVSWLSREGRVDRDARIFSAPGTADTTGSGTRTRRRRRH